MAAPQSLFPNLCSHSVCQAWPGPPRGRQNPSLLRNVELGGGIGLNMTLEVGLEGMAEAGSDMCSARVGRPACHPGPVQQMSHPLIPRDLRGRSSGLAVIGCLWSGFVSSCHFYENP